MSQKAIQLIESERHKLKTNSLWYQVWRWRYDQQIAAKARGAEAGNQADRALSIRISRDIGMNITPTSTMLWRRKYAPGWAANNHTIKVDIPSLTALAGVEQPDSDDPIPERLWLALKCFTMELCGYTLQEIADVTLRTTPQVVELTDYANRQEHAWREGQVREIMKIARGKRNLIDDREPANPEPQEVQL